MTDTEERYLAAIEKLKENNEKIKELSISNQFYFMELEHILRKMKKSDFFRFC